MNGNLDCLKCLIKASANIWIKNKRGDYPIHSIINTIASNKSNNKSVEYTQLFGKRRKIMLIFLFFFFLLGIIRYIFFIYPNKVNIQNDERRTPLHLAASYGDIEICRLLLECGARVNSFVQNVAVSKKILNVKKNRQQKYSNK